MSSASALREGAYSARWGKWVVLLNGQDGAWRTKVWRWTPGKSVASRVEIGSAEGFTSPRDAARWAADRMRDDGAIVLVLDAPQFKLEDALDFTPAPTLVGE
jgi:hypothetical protein